MNSEEKAKLNGKEIRDIVIEAGIQAIPWVGSSLSTLYFGTKQEKQFKRLEAFYKELAYSIEGLKNSISPIESHDKEALTAIIEEINEKVEHEQTIQKREFLKNYLRNTLIYPIKDENYDERRVFLNLIDSMSLLECEILALLYNQTNAVSVGNISKPGVDQYAIVGAIGRLKSYGFLVSFQGSFSIGGGQDNILSENERISNFGRRFCEFCLNG